MDAPQEDEQAAVLVLPEDMEDYEDMFPPPVHIPPQPVIDPEVCSYIKTHVGESIIRLGYRMYDQLKRPDENIYFSPFGVHAMITALNHGATYATRQEIDTVLNLYDLDLVGRAYKAIYESWPEESDEFFIYILIGIFIDSRYPFKTSFANSIKDRYHADAKGVPFQNKSGSANYINTYFFSQSRNKIFDNIVQPSDFDASDRLIAVNSTAFSNCWFDRGSCIHSLADPFRINKTETCECHMIFMYGSMPYVENKELESQLVLVPFKNPDFSLLVVLPKSHIYGTELLERRLVHLDIPETISSMSNELVDLYIPTFELEFTHDLTDTLKQVGIRDMFSNRPCFDKIRGHRPNESTVGVTKVLQRVTLKMHEEIVGIIDYESTLETEQEPAPFMKPRDPRQEKKVVKCLNPFLIFVLYHYKETYIPLFMGKISKPAGYVPPTGQPRPGPSTR